MLYQGDNIHAYTSHVQAELQKIKRQEWEHQHLGCDALLDELKQHFPSKPAVANIREAVRNNKLTDPHLGGDVNILFLLEELWVKTKKQQEFSTFGTLLDQIDRTCIQGITHRIIMDYVAIVVE